MNFAIIGNPVEHSLSPALHNRVFDHLRLDAHYTKLPVEKNELPQVVKKLQRGELDGINVTIPYKQDIIPYLDELNIRAKHIHAVNCVVKNNGKLIGFNTDWYGFTMTLHHNKIDVSERTCAILGAGGAARSILYALIQEGADTVLVINRTPKRAEALIASLNEINKNTRLQSISPGEIKNNNLINTVIINCTPVGMAPNINETPLPEDFIGKDQILIDTIYNPLQTRFLNMGKEKGAITIGGLDMFIYQGLASLDLWFNEPISDTIDVNELRQYLTIQLQKIA